MATGGQNSVGNKTKCPLCTETFRSPKILRCLHTFCEECIHEYLVSLARNKGSKIEEFNCPVCRNASRPPNNEEDVEKWASKLQDNAVMKAILLASTGEKQQCHACLRVNEKIDAVVWCIECAEALCERCNDVHRKIKNSVDHKVVPLAELESKSKGYDLNAIGDACNKHPGTPLLKFCEDHSELCCNTCLWSDHKYCKTVTAIEASKSLNADEKCDTLLKEMREELGNLLTQIEQEKIELTKNVKSVEKEASEFVEEIKRKMDDLLVAYCKQTTVLHEERNTKLNVLIRLLEQSIQSLEYWIESTEVLRDMGQKKQLCIFVKMFKEQIRLCKEELSAIFESDNTLKLDFIADESAKSMLQLSSIASVVKSELHHENQMDNVFKLCKQLKIKPNFDTLKVEFVRYFHYPNSNLSCGASIGSQVMFLGNIESKGLLLVNSQNGQQIQSSTFQNDPECNSCRCLYDSQHSQLFIACNRPAGGLYRAAISCSDITDIREADFCKEYVGAMLRHEQYVHIIVDRAIKTFPVLQDPSSDEEMSTVFTTNTDNDKSLGLEFYDGDLIYTTKDEEVKRTSLHGTEIFCFKSEAMKQPKCLCVLPFGLTLVVDKSSNGSLHLISTDGKRHRTLLEEFKHISNPLDIFLDDDAEILYVVGGEYVEIYNII